MRNNQANHTNPNVLEIDEKATYLEVEYFSKNTPKSIKQLTSIVA